MAPATMPTSRPRNICWVSVNPRRGVDGVWASGTPKFYPNTPVVPAWYRGGLMRHDRRGREPDRVVRRSRSACRVCGLYAVPAVRLRAVQRTGSGGDQVVRLRMSAGGRGAGADCDGDALPRGCDRELREL